MSTSVRESYHHGDLRAALIQGASELLESGEPFSLRAVARAAGVSATAPYRHFADRQALESALAVQGFKDLHAELEAASTSTDLTSIGQAYVRFALKRPAVFQLMFGSQCNTEDPERVAAVADLHNLVETRVREIFGGEDVSALALALWSTAHGLAFLHLDGKLSAESDAEVSTRVSAAFSGLLAMPRPRDS